MKRTVLTIAAVTTVLSGTVMGAEKPVKIYIFSGQSNMQARYGNQNEQPIENFFDIEKHKDKKIWHVAVGNIWSRKPIQETPAFGVDRAMLYMIADEVDQVSQRERRYDLVQRLASTQCSQAGGRHSRSSIQEHDPAISQYDCAS